ncbi:ribosome-recycling factor, putative [Plasmodium relictum]|uniref:Ribosome-recycling factor, putative n=1 Tax=Plasmodium relictum TaxID=85471 RepID=A0A1J1H205_PLARL|nr:ribosome-recycling factor, putative [Plasmodium relictum]CRG98790.1 ribosome-recycling factor, putative [Plasmodium relictum]
MITQNEKKIRKIILFYFFLILFLNKIIVIYNCIGIKKNFKYNIFLINKNKYSSCFLNLYNTYNKNILNNFKEIIYNKEPSGIKTKKNTYLIYLQKKKKKHDKIEEILKKQVLNNKEQNTLENEDISKANEIKPKEKKKKKASNDKIVIDNQIRGNDSFSLKNYQIKKSIRDDIKEDEDEDDEDNEEENNHLDENGEEEQNEDENNNDEEEEEGEEKEEEITEEDIGNLNKMCLDKMNNVYNYIRKESYRFNLNNVSNVMFENEKVKINERIYIIKHICHIKKKENLFTITPYDPYFVNFIYQHFVKQYNELKFYIKDKSVFAIIPPISESLKNEIRTKIKSKIEDSKLTLRNVRKQMMDKLEKIKNKIGKDIYFKQKNYIQSLHDQTKKSIEKISEELK